MHDGGNTPFLTQIRMPPSLPRPFIGLAWANLAVQSAEQLSLAATPIVAVLLLGAGPGEVGLLGTAQTLPFLLLSIPLGIRKPNPFVNALYDRIKANPTRRLRIVTASYTASGY